MRVMPSVASGRYSPGPGTVKLLEDGVYQEIRPAVANCSPEWPDFLAIESGKLEIGDFSLITTQEALAPSRSALERYGLHPGE
jgi:hypothetical protein